ncbi:hypothetical protein D3C71_2242630 [compost metagenome]
MRAVGQQDAAKLRGAHGAEDPTAEAVAHQQRQIAAVIDMGMREHHRIERSRIDRKGVPIAQA